MEIVGNRRLMNFAQPKYIVVLTVELLQAKKKLKKLTKPKIEN
jgi:hypothetical protein